MKAEKLLRAIGEVEDKYLLEAQEAPSKRSPYKFALLAAACLVVISAVALGAVFLPQLFAAKSADPAYATGMTAEKMEALNEAGGHDYEDDNGAADGLLMETLPPEQAEPNATPEAAGTNSAAASLSDRSGAVIGGVQYPPGISVAVLEGIEQAEEGKWRLNLRNTLGEIYELEISGEKFAMPPESLEVGAVLEIRHGEAYEPMQVLYYVETQE